MKNRPLLIITGLMMGMTAIYGQVGFENYAYLGQEQAITLVPIIHVQKNNWYAEARYNYEEQKTASMYLGRKIEKTGQHISYSIIPLIGGMFGRYKGGSTGLTISIDYKNFFLSSQPQFTVFAKHRSLNYFFHWSEAGYDITPWLFVGCSMQQTYYTQSKTNEIEPGLLAGLSLGKWILPLYIFSPFSTNRYVIIGITFGLGAINPSADL